MGRYNESLQAYDMAIEHNLPGAAVPSSWILTKEGKVLDRLGRHEGALEAFDRATEAFPQHTDAWLGKGMALSNDSQRLQAFETALKLDPRNIKAWRYRGIALVNLAERKGNQSLYEDALKSYDKALDIDPREPRFWLNKANTLVAMGRLNESVESFDKAIELISADDTHRRAYFWRMKGSALEKDRPEEASRAYNESLKWLNRTIDLDQKDPGAWTSRGYFLIYPLRRYNESQADFDRAMELIPANDTETLA